MIDYAALEAALANDAAYHAPVVAGNNSGLVALLNAPDGVLAKRWRPILVADFLAAIAGETLDTAQTNQITTYTLNISHVPVHKAAVRSWIQSQGWQVSTVDAIKALSEVPGRPCDAFIGDDDMGISLNDVRKVVKLVSKSPY